MRAMHGTGGDTGGGVKGARPTRPRRASGDDKTPPGAEIQEGRGGKEGVQAVAQTEEGERAPGRPGRESGRRRGAGDKNGIRKRGAAGGACNPGEW